MKAAAIVLYALGLVSELYVLRILVREVGKVRRATKDERRFVIDGGDVHGNTKGTNFTTTLDTYGEALDQGNHVIIALALGIVFGAAGNFVSVLS